MKTLDQTKVYGGTEDDSFTLQKDKFMYSESFQMKFFCPFNFTDFPYDSNTCCLDYRVRGAQNMILNTAKIIYETDVSAMALNVPFGMATDGSFKSPEIFEPARIPVAAGKKIEKTVKKFSPSE